MYIKGKYVSASQDDLSFEEESDPAFKRSAGTIGNSLKEELTEEVTSIDVFQGSRSSYVLS